MDEEKIKFQKFDPRTSPMSKIKLGNVANMVTYDHGCILLHPREQDGSPIFTYGIETYADFEKQKQEQDRLAKFSSMETP